MTGLQQPAAGRPGAVLSIPGSGKLCVLDARPVQTPAASEGSVTPVLWMSKPRHKDQRPVPGTPWATVAGRLALPVQALSGVTLQCATGPGCQILTNPTQRKHRAHGSWRGRPGTGWHFHMQNAGLRADIAKLNRALLPFSSECSYLWYVHHPNALET